MQNASVRRMGKITMLKSISGQKDPKDLKVAIVHYWLVNMRGGEKVIEAILELFPQADIFTHVYDPDRISASIRKQTVKTTFINELPFAKKYYRNFLPLMPVALEQLDLSEYDLVISSESGPAKGVITHPEALHICYTHSPMRYLWDQYHAYKKSAGLSARLAMPWLTNSLRNWDVTSAARVDHFVANSNAVASRINKFWRRDADVIAPPVEVDRFDATMRRHDFYLYVGELVSYKRADIAIEACNKLNRKLVVIGKGPDEAWLRRIAGPNVTFLGRAPDELLAQSYATCKALLFPTEEDFGIVPVEAMAAGAPVLAYNRGGARDYVIEGVTGMFHDEQSPENFANLIERYEGISNQFDHAAIRSHAETFHREVFKQRFSDLVNRLLEPKPRQNMRGPVPVSHAE